IDWHFLVPLGWPGPMRLQLESPTGRRRPAEMGPETVRGLEQALNVHLRQVERLQAQLRSLRSAVVNTIAALLEARDQATSAHSEAVTECAVLVARELGLTNADVDAVRMAALLHDVGKIAVADAVLLKPGRRPAAPRDAAASGRHSRCRAAPPRAVRRRRLPRRPGRRGDSAGRPHRG